jgi:hypothetical protein
VSPSGNLDGNTLNWGIERCADSHDKMPRTWRGGSADTACTYAGIRAIDGGPEPGWSVAVAH